MNKYCVWVCDGAGVGLSIALFSLKSSLGRFENINQPQIDLGVIEENRIEQPLLNNYKTFYRVHSNEDVNNEDNDIIC